MLSNKNFLCLLFAQFLSAFADNALIFILLASLAQHHNTAQAPLLQELFVVPFILLAPFVGQLADAYKKSALLQIGNAVKLLGAALTLTPCSPFISYAIVGIGAAIYSPAKYGSLPELVAPHKLIAANSAIEGSTIAAILMGALAGGLLADQSIPLALSICVASYAIAQLPLLVLKSPSSTLPLAPLSQTLQSFLHDLKSTCSNPTLRPTLIGTASFWGAGASLRLLLVAWIPFALNLHGPKWPSFFMGALSLGIILGATLAAKFISLPTLHRAYYIGPLIGLSVLLLSSTHSTPIAMALAALVGLFGGLHVIPLNAQLQHTTHNTLGSGKALAIQNFFENSTILLFAALTSTLTSALHLNPTQTVSSFAAIMTTINLLLLWPAYKSHR